MYDEFPLGPENLPPEYMHHLGHSTRGMDEFFTYLYPALTEEPSSIPSEPTSRTQDRCNDWGDPDGPCAWR